MKKLLFTMLLIIISSATLHAQVDTCANQFIGDVDNSGSYDVADLVYLMSFLYQSGPTPPVLSNADVNGDCVIDTNDVVLMAEAGNNISLFVDCTCIAPSISSSSSCCEGTLGDIDETFSGSMDIGDLVYIVAFMFLEGPPPACLAEVDFNADGEIDISDLILIVSYMFGGTILPDCP